MENNRGIVASAAKVEVQQGYATAERFVSFLDIMGFKDFVARNEHSVILAKLSVLTDFISETVGSVSGFHFSMFSDSILLYSDSSQSDDFESIVRLTSDIVRESISIGLPIKGAIAKGVCTATTGDKLLYFGQPIIDAFKLEENIVIYGVAIHNTAEQEALFLAKKTGTDLVYDYKVVLKNAVSKHYLLNWYGNQADDTINMLINIRLTVSDAPRRYIDNTIDAINSLMEKS